MPFSRGLYGEILLTLPLITSLLEARSELVINNEQIEPTSKPNPLDKAALFYNYHQHLLQLLSGNDSENSDLYRAVMQGEPLSLCPAEMNGLTFKTFVPILRRIGDDQWQIGISGHGHEAILTGDALSALQQVWQFYSEWLVTEVVDGEQWGKEYPNGSAV